jgi:CheY-like chemotaxis protein
VARTALVVEDDRGLVIIYERVLSELGYQVIEARNGAIAIDLLKDLIPDIIFLDVLLPEVNGLDVITYIVSQPHLREVRVIVASSNGQFHKHAQQLPNGHFVLKPIRPQHIRDLAE